MTVPSIELVPTATNNNNIIEEEQQPHPFVADEEQQEQERQDQQQEEQQEQEGGKTSSTMMKPTSAPPNNSVDIGHSKKESLSSSPIYYTVRFRKEWLIFAAILACISILALSETTYKTQVEEERNEIIRDKANHPKDDKGVFDSYSHTKGDKYPTTGTTNGSSNDNDTNGVEHFVEPPIESNQVKMKLPRESNEDHDERTLSYYHCGTAPSSLLSEKEGKELVEVILLHGAKFTKEDWKTSQILQHLCVNGNKLDKILVSVTAIDLSVKSDGYGLKAAFDALVENNVLTGRRAVIVTPSASGKTIVSMVQKNEKKMMLDLVKAWVPIASPAVLQLNADDDLWSIFQELDIPVLAMNGDSDKMGAKVTKTLASSEASAISIEMKGGHPCYLDSPIYFVQVMLSFVQRLPH